MEKNLQEGFLISQKLRELLFFQSWVTFLYTMEQLQKFGNMSIKHQPCKDTGSVISVITNAFLQLLNNALRQRTMNPLLPQFNHAKRLSNHLDEGLHRVLQG